MLILLWSQLPSQLTKKHSQGLRQMRPTCRMSSCSSPAIGQHLAFHSQPVATRNSSRRSRIGRLRTTPRRNFQDHLLPVPPRWKYAALRMQRDYPVLPRTTTAACKVLCVGTAISLTGLVFRNDLPRQTVSCPWTLHQRTTSDQPRTQRQ